MDNKKSIVSLKCLTCNEYINIEADEIEKEVPIFADNHKNPNCVLEGFINNRSIGPFVRDNKKTDKKLLN